MNEVDNDQKAHQKEHADGCQNSSNKPPLCLSGSRHFGNHQLSSLWFTKPDRHGGCHGSRAARTHVLLRGNILLFIAIGDSQSLFHGYHSAVDVATGLKHQTVLLRK